MTDPAAVRDLVSCDHSEVRALAVKHNLHPGGARIFRDHWQRRLFGRCSSCGHYLKKGQCPKCKTESPPDIEMLEKIDENAVLWKRPCRECSGTISYRAKFILKMVKEKGQFKPARYCNKCKRTFKAEKERNKVLTHRPLQDLNKVTSKKPEGALG